MITLGNLSDECCFWLQNRCLYRAAPSLSEPGRSTTGWSWRCWSFGAPEKPDAFWEWAPRTAPHTGTPRTELRPFILIIIVTVKNDKTATVVSCSFLGSRLNFECFECQIGFPVAIILVIGMAWEFLRRMLNFVGGRIMAKLAPRLLFFQYSDLVSY